MNTSDKGKVLELHVLTRLFERGYEIAIPFGTQQHWDLLCWKKNKFQRIQVKTARLRGVGGHRVCVDFLRSKDRVENKKTGEWNYKGYSEKEVDWIIAVTPRTRLMWIIPIAEAKHRRSMSFAMSDYPFDW